MDELREKLKEKIKDIKNTDELLQDILVELMIFNETVNASRLQAKEYKQRTKEQIDAIKEQLPPQAQAIYKSLLKGVV